VTVSKSVTQNESTLYRSQFSTDVYHTLVTTNVESQEMWLPIIFGGNPKYFSLPNRKWNINRHYWSYQKYI